MPVRPDKGAAIVMEITKIYQKEINKGFFKI